VFDIECSDVISLKFIGDIISTLIDAT